MVNHHELEGVISRSFCPTEHFHEAGIWGLAVCFDGNALLRGFPRNGRWQQFGQHVRGLLVEVPAPLGNRPTVEPELPHPNSNRWIDGLVKRIATTHDRMPQHWLDDGRLIRNGRRRPSCAPDRGTGNQKGDNKIAG
jgi:hypothetical protein